MMSQMKTGIFCYSLKGKETASKIAEIIKKEYDADIECFSPERMADGNFGPIPRPSGDFYGGHFRDKELFISVGSVGICVRHIAPYVKSKVTDPAVIVIDVEQENLKIPFVGRFIAAVGCLPLDRDNPKNAVRTIRKAAENIKNGYANYGIYPEGWENKNFIPFDMNFFMLSAWPSESRLCRQR